MVYPTLAYGGCSINGSFLDSWEVSVHISFVCPCDRSGKIDIFKLLEEKMISEHQEASPRLHVAQ